MGILPINALAITFASALCMCCCNVKHHSNSGTTLPAQQQMDSLALAVRVLVFSNDTMPGHEQSGGYGYDIFIGDDRYIRQHSIPAVPGNIVFSSKEKAFKTAGMVARKILQHTLPPSVTLAELDSIGVLK